MYGARYRGEVTPDFAAEVLMMQDEPYHIATAWYEEVLSKPEFQLPHMRYLASVDRYWLLTEICGRTDMLHQWLYERCREVQSEPDECLDLWSREHYKSTIITFGGILQEIINDPEMTVAIFSFNKPTATAFLRQLQREMESNPKLQRLYPEIFWLDPRNEAPQWNQQSGLIVKRQGNPKEATIEAHGLVDGQPTSKHYRLRVYDDVVTRESVTTPDMIKKVTEAWELSDNLAAVDEVTGTIRRWHAGTRYHFADTYGLMLERGLLKARIYPATDTGTAEGNPVLWSREVWDKKRKTQKSTMAAQLLLNPLAGAERTFDPQWLQTYEVIPAILSVYILIDPSRGRTKGSDRTAMAVIGIGMGGTKYLLDGFRHRMQLSERWEHMRDLYKKWSKHPGVQSIRVGYERFGQASDDEYFQERMREEKIDFAIDELSWPREGSASKNVRIARLEPDVKSGRFRLPAIVYKREHGGNCVWRVDAGGHMHYTPVEGYTKAQRVMAQRRTYERIVRPIRRLDEEREPYDLTLALIEELMFFPIAPHDDLSDACSRIYDLEPAAPTNYEVERVYLESPEYEDS